MSKLFKLPLVCVAILCEYSAIAQAPTELFALDETLITFGDEIEGESENNFWFLRDEKFSKDSTVTTSEEFPESMFRAC